MAAHVITATVKSKSVSEEIPAECPHCARAITVVVVGALMAASVGKADASFRAMVAVMPGPQPDLTGVVPHVDPEEEEDTDIDPQPPRGMHRTSG